MATRIPLVVIDGLVRALPTGDSITGPVELNPVSITTTSSLTTETMVRVDSSGGAITITLPPAADFVNIPIHIKLVVAGNTVTIEGDGVETIDGSLTLTMNNQYDAPMLISDGTEWNII